MITALEKKHIQQLNLLMNGLDTFTEDEIKSVLGMIDEYLKKEEDYLFYVFMEEEKVVGFICYGLASLSVNSYDLYWIAVSKHAQGSGIGTQLLEFMYKYIAERKGHMVIAETSSQPHYEATRKFYDKKGYLLETKLKDYYKKGDDKLFYVKRF